MGDNELIAYKIVTEKQKKERIRRRKEGLGWQTPIIRGKSRMAMDIKSMR